MKSPYTLDKETGFYRSFQLINEPFELKVSKSLNIDAEGHLTLYDLSAFAVYKSDPDGNEVSVVILSESALNIVFTNFSILSVPDSLNSGTSGLGVNITQPSFIPNGDALSGAKQCLVTGENCFQFFEMIYDDSSAQSCPFDFTGDPSPPFFCVFLFLV